MGEHYPACELRTCEADCNEEYRCVGNIEICAEEAEAQKRKHRQGQAEAVDEVNVLVLYKLIDYRESAKLNGDEYAEEHSAAALGVSNVLCKKDNARRKDLHTDGLTDIHTEKLSEGLDLEGCYKLTDVKLGFCVGNLYPFLNEYRTKDDGQGEEDAEADTDDEVKGCKGYLTLIVHSRKYSGENGARRSTNSGNHEAQTVRLITLGTYCAYLSGHTAIRNVDDSGNGVIEKIGNGAISKSLHLAVKSNGEEGERKRRNKKHAANEDIGAATAHLSSRVITDNAHKRVAYRIPKLGNQDNESCKKWRKLDYLYKEEQGVYNSDKSLSATAVNVGRREECALSLFHRSYCVIFHLFTPYPRSLILSTRGI